MVGRVLGGAAARSDVLRCAALLVAAVAVSWPHIVTVSISHWVMRAVFTLVISLFFTPTRQMVVDMVTNVGAQAGAVNFFGQPAPLSAASASAAGTPVAARAVAAKGIGEKGVVVAKTVSKWRWSDEGDAVHIVVQLPERALQPSGGGILVPPTAECKVMPSDFKLTIMTQRREQYTLHKENLYGAVDPRISKTRVDPATGAVTLVLMKWHDNTTWKALLDDGKHPMSRVSFPSGGKGEAVAAAAAELGVNCGAAQVQDESERYTAGAGVGGARRGKIELINPRGVKG